MTFVSLDTICDNAALVKEAVSDSIQATACSDGLRKQYAIQLRWLHERIPSLEIVLGPGPVALPRKLLRIPS